MNSPFLKALTGEKPEYTPVWFMRQAGRFLPEYRVIRAKHKDFFELCRNVEAAIEITALPVRLLGVDAAILFSDLLVPLLPFKSMNVSLQERIGPVIETKVPLTEPEKLFHSYPVREDLSLVADIVSGFKKEISKHTTNWLLRSPFHPLKLCHRRWRFQKLPQNQKVYVRTSPSFCSNGR